MAGQKTVAGSGTGKCIKIDAPKENYRKGQFEPLPIRTAAESIRKSEQYGYHWAWPPFTTFLNKKMKRSTSLPKITSFGRYRIVRSHFPTIF